MSKIVSKQWDLPLVEGGKDVSEKEYHSLMVRWEDKNRRRIDEPYKVRDKVVSKSADPVNKDVSTGIKVEIKGGAVHKPCWHTHPVFNIPVGDKVYPILGGSATQVTIKEGDVDVFVGLDSSMPRTELGLPWKKGLEVYFHITDMEAPKDPVEFAKLIGFLEDCLLDNKIVFVGCIGGHGRTGTVLAALVKKMSGIEDSITYVRTHYCAKAVETVGQVNFLNTHWGIKKVEGSKVHLKGGSYKGGSYFDGYDYKNSKFSGTGESMQSIRRMPCKGHVHGNNVA